MTKQELLALVDEYLASVADNSLAAQGYVENRQFFYFYPATKLALTTYSRIFSQLPEILSRSIQVIDVHPGYIATDLNGHKGTGTLAEGIDTLSYVIHLPFELNK